MIPIPGEEVAACFVSVSVDRSGLKSGMAAAKSEALGLSASIGSAFSGLTSMINPATIAIAGATVAITAMGSAVASSISAAADFQQSMANVASVAGGGAEAMQVLSDAAREAGAGTVFSASQAAEAEYYLASAGMQTNEIVSSLGDTLLLAGAGNLELGRSAEIVTGTLAQYQMTADETGRVVNVLAAAASGSNTTINQLGVGMAKVGSLANAAGISFESTSAALMVLADANIKGEEGGTALRGILASLADITPKGTEALEEMGLSAEDINPQMHSLDEIFQTLNEHGLDMATAIKLFGREAASGGMVLTKASGDIKTYGDAITDTTKAEDMYATQTDTFQASMSMLGSAIEEAKISLGNVFLPVLTDVAGGLAEGVTAITGFGQSLYGIGQGVNSALEPLGGLVGVIEQITLLGPALDVAGSATGFIGDLASDLSSLATGDINIGGEYFGSAEDLKAARDAGKLTGDEYINGIRDLIQSKSDVSGIDTSRLMHNIQGFAEEGLLDEDQYVDALESIAEIYEEVGDAAYEMADPITEAFEDGSISAEDYISILEGMADVTTDIGDGAEDVLEPLTKAFEDGSITVDEYKSTLETLSEATSSLGADFDSIAGPIQEAFADGELSVEQYQDALSTVAQAHEQLGASTQSVLSPLSEMFASGEISADEYISSLNAVLAGVDSWGPEFNRRMADLNANAGNLSAEEYMTAFNVIISDLGIEVEKTLEDVDTEGAGEEAGEVYGEAFSEKVAKSYEYSLSNLARGGAARYQTTGEMSVEGETLRVVKTADANMNWSLMINGETVSSGYGGSDLWDDFVAKYPALAALTDPREFDAMVAEAGGEEALAAEIRAEITLEANIETISPYEARDTTQSMAEFWAENADIVEAGGDELLLKLYNLESRLQTEGAAGWETAWANIFDPDATDQQISTAIAALDLSETEVALVENLREMLGDIDAAEVFEDLFSEEIPISFSSMISAGLTDFNELFEDVGSQARSAFNNGLSEEEAFSIAGMYAEMKDTDAAMFAEMGGDDALAWWEEAARLIDERNLVASVGGDTSLLDSQLDEFFGTYNGEVEVEVSGLSAFQTALWWEDWGGKEIQEDMGSLAETFEKVGLAAEAMGGEVEDAWNVVTDPDNYDPETVVLGIKTLIDAFPDIDPQLVAQIANFWSENVTEGIKSATVEMPDWWSTFGTWQEENAEDLFNQSYRGATEGYAGPGQGATTMTVAADTSEADAAVDELEDYAEATRITPIQADIGPALEVNEELVSVLTKPVTKQVHIEVVGGGAFGWSGSGGGGGWSASEFLGGTTYGGTVPSGWWTPGSSLASDVSLAEGGIATYPIAALIGDAPTPEVVAPLGDLLPMIQQAVAVAGGNGGGNTYQLIVQGNITEDIWPTVRSEMQQMIEENNNKLSDAYVGRSR